MKKKLAVITKEDMKSSEIRAHVLADIERDGSFSLSVLDDASQITDEDEVLVFGGDGTVLEVVRAVADKNIPLLCVNLGNLGFWRNTKRRRFAIGYIRVEIFRFDRKNASLREVFERNFRTRTQRSCDSFAFVTSHIRRRVR